MSRLRWRQALAPLRPGRPSRACVLAASLTMATLLPAAVLPTTVPTAPAATGPAATTGEAPGIELVHQTPVVRPGGRVELTLRLPGAPDDGFVQVEPHHRIRSRSEFDRSTEGQGLRPAIAPGSPMRLDELPVDATGARTVPLLLDPELPGGVAISAAGTYPVRIRLTGPGGDELASLVTHVVVADDRDEAPPLAVAVVADLRAPPALRPGGSIEPDPGTAEVLEGMLAVLAEAEGVPVTLVVAAETVESLAAAGGGELLDRLAEAAATNVVLGAPYTDTSVEGLVRAQLTGELDRSLDRARSVLTGELGAEPTTGAWLADADLGPAGLAALGDRGVRHLVLHADQLDAAPDGPLSLAKRFGLAVGAAEASPAGGGTVAQQPPPRIDAFEIDAGLAARLDGPGSPGLVAQQVLAELAVIWFEQPAIPRGAILVVDGETDSDVLAAVLEGLGADGVIEPVTIAELFEHADALTDPSGATISRSLRPDAPPRFDPALRAILEEARLQLAGYESLIGPASPRAQPLLAQLLLATARTLDAAERLAHVDTVLAEITEVREAVRTPAEERITLTSREATIPLTLQNEAGFPLDVVIHLDSQKLEFPSGEQLEVTLSEPTTRVDLAVRTLATGGFPLDVRVTSPDGSLELATIRYTVQSTAVSGVGLVMSVGAGLFLLAWWVSHWHRTRRSRRLVPLDRQ